MVSSNITRIRKNERHGMEATSEYGSWRCMIQRCTNPHDGSYKDYGKRGITVCDRWLYSFNNFYMDMGLKPFKEAQLDRKDNDLGYYKDNCHWATSAYNCRNRSNNKLTISEVRNIRKEYRKGGITQLALAKANKVTQPMVSRIVRNIYWVE